jgi:nucleotide-binding universal stress UspA family protein
MPLAGLGFSNRYRLHHVAGFRRKPMKSILLHVQDDAGFAGRTEIALDLARATGGHISCVHATSPQAYVGFDGFGAMFMMEEVMKVAEEHDAKMRAATEKLFANEDVSWDYRQVMSEVSGALIGESYLNDLIIMGRPLVAKDRPLAIPQIGDVLMHARIPVLVVPENKNTLDFRNVAMVAWNGSREAADALRQAVPLLALAKAVHVVTVEDERENLFPVTDASEYLSRHGISSELHDRKASKQMVEAELDRCAVELGADYLVMGAYSHSRAREYVFGGVTRYMLHEATLPVLLAH